MRRATDVVTLAGLVFLLESCLARDLNPEASAERLTSDGFTSVPFTGDKFAWPPGKKAAVSLTYDDALTSQLDHAAPALAKHGLRGTFFVTDIARSNADRWSALLGRGHELGAHTLRHPCDGRESWVKKGNALQDYDLPRMETELEESIAFLQLLGATRGPYTFAYPCGSTWVGASYQSYTSIVRKHFVAARGTASTFADPSNESFDSVPSVSGDKSAAELVGLVQAVEQDGGWLIFMFHGVGADHMAVEVDAHEALLAHLEHRGRIWTDTFVRISSYVMSHRPPAVATDAGSGG